MGNKRNKILKIKQIGQTNKLFHPPARIPFAPLYSRLVIGKRKRSKAARLPEGLFLFGLFVHPICRFCFQIHSAPSTAGSNTFSMKSTRSNTVGLKYDATPTATSRSGST